MATSTVSTLTAEYDVLMKDIERMQEEHPDSQFPEHIAESWDRANKNARRAEEADRAGTAQRADGGAAALDPGERRGSDAGALPGR